MHRKIRSSSFRRSRTLLRDSCCNRELIFAPLDLPFKLLFANRERHLLRAGNVRRDLHCERRTSAILGQRRVAFFFIENRSEFRCVSAADGEENRLAYFTREGSRFALSRKQRTKLRFVSVRENFALVILLLKMLGLFSISSAGAVTVTFV